MVNLSGLDYGLMHAIDPRLLNLTPMLNLKVGLDKLRDKWVFFRMRKTNKQKKHICQIGPTESVVFYVCRRIWHYLFMHVKVHFSNIVCFTLRYYTMKRYIFLLFSVRHCGFLIIDWAYNIPMIYSVLWIEHILFMHEVLCESWCVYIEYVTMHWCIHCI